MTPAELCNQLWRSFRMPYGLVWLGWAWPITTIIALLLDRKWLIFSLAIPTVTIITLLSISYTLFGRQVDK